MNTLSIICVLATLCVATKTSTENNFGNSLTWSNFRVMQPSGKYSRPTTFHLNTIANGDDKSTCVCTRVNCPKEGDNRLNYSSKENFGVYHYRKSTSSDHTLVVDHAYANITLSNLDMGTETTSCTQRYAKMMNDQSSSVDAGHILAHRLGGQGTEPINIFPQNPSMNRGIYAQFEKKIYVCMLKCERGYAILKWNFTYVSDSNTRPYSVKYSAEFYCTNTKNPNGVCATLDTVIDNY